MEYARVKVFSLRKKLYLLQKDILDLAFLYQTTDYQDPRIKRKHMESIVTDFVLKGWTEKYIEESQMFWQGDNLNTLD